MKIICLKILREIRGVKNLYFIDKEFLITPEAKSLNEMRKVLMNNFGILKLDPSAKISYGVTSLSDYTDFLSNVTTGVNDIHESQMFEIGNVAIGFLFHMEPVEIDTGTIRTHGGLEYVHDISPTTTFFHSNLSGAQSTKIGKYKLLQQII